MTTIHHIYACSREEPAKRVLMYQVGLFQLDRAIRILELKPEAVCPEAPGYYSDSMGGLWWVKSYGESA